MQQPVETAASDHEDAFRKALARGRAMGQDYVNTAGERVQWRLELVETIDELDDEIGDGREVYSEPLPASASQGSIARPEDSRPGSSGV